MPLDRADRKRQAEGDLAIAEPCPHQAADLPLAPGEAVLGLTGLRCVLPEQPPERLGEGVARAAEASAA